MNDQSKTLHEVFAYVASGEMGKAFTLILNEAMLYERQQYLNAEPNERSESRVSQANGFKKKTLKTKVGALALSVPQTRDGLFYPSTLEKGERSEKALILAIAEMYFSGVSTRKVSKILKTLCGFEISSSDVSRATAMLDEVLDEWRKRPLSHTRYLLLDARYEKVRDDKLIKSMAVLVAVGIDEEGQRSVLGTNVSYSEHSVHWKDFLSHLVSRGMHSVQLVSSDAHEGLKHAIDVVLPGTLWQRCQFHLQQNAMQYLVKTEQREELAEDIRDIYNAPDIDQAYARLKRVADKWEGKSSRLADWLIENMPEGLNVFSVLKEHRIKLRTSNMVERLNREIKRRTNVARIFPNAASCLRLVSAVLMDISDGWAEKKVYLKTSVQSLKSKSNQ